MKLEHVFAATNRQPNSTFWVPNTGILLTAARSTVLVHQLSPHHQNRVETYNRHKSDVNRISGEKDWIVTAGIDGELILWRLIKRELQQIASIDTVHSDAVSSLALLNFDDDWNVLCSIAGDHLALTGINSTNPENIKTAKYTFKSIYPLCLAATKVVRQNGDREIIVAVATSDFFLRFFIIDEKLDIDIVETSKMQIGEDWSTSLRFSCSLLDSCIYLAVANNDKRTRIIKLFRDSESEEEPEDRLQVDKKVLVADEFEIKTETILRGHQNWVTATCWFTLNETLHLVTSSMDKSIVIWTADSSEEDIWQDAARLGQFGGANMGFLGLTAGRSESGELGVLAHSYTGSFHLWWWNAEEESWKSSISPSGHFGPVRDISWSEDKSFLLSTSFDQTTRLFSEVNMSSHTYWAEVARPQVHGHDIRCMTRISSNRFASGAEEKVIRVFRSTRNFRENFQAITGYSIEATEGEPEGAAVPALGLSNKAVYEKHGKVAADREIQAHESYMEDQFTALNLGAVPLEADLIQNTLWWEERKLYGHGSELQALTSSNDGKWLASSCKASKQSQATILIWDASQDGKPAALAKLEHHQLTVIQLRFSPNSRRLLSVGRDRIAVVWKLNGSNGWELEKVFDKSMKAHSRIIWNCCWLCDESFITAGRDKQLIVWKNQDGQWIKLSSLVMDQAITAVDSITINNKESMVLIGKEDGKLVMYKFDEGELVLVKELSKDESHRGPVTQVRFRDPKIVATCGEDHQVKLFALSS